MNILMKVLVKKVFCLILIQNVTVIDDDDTDLEMPNQCNLVNDVDGHLMNINKTVRAFFLIDK